MRRLLPIGLLVAALVAVGAVVALSTRDAPPPVRRVAAARVDVRAPAAALTQQTALLRLFSGDLSGLIAQIQPRDPYELRVDELVRDGVTLRDLVVRRQGEGIAAEATLDPDALASAAPAGVTLHYVPQDDGSVVLEGKARRFGIDVPVSMRVQMSDGGVVAQPQGLPIGTTTLFSDPRVLIDGITARPAPDGKVRLRAVGRLGAA